MQVEKKNKAIAYRNYKHFTQQCCYDYNLTLICSKNYKTNKTTTARKLQSYEAARN